MFYVAFLLEPRINVVIPTNWVYENQDQWQKFVNLGLNKNQKHRIFYTENPCAWNETGEPSNEYEVDFCLDAEHFPDEGYNGKLKRFFMDFGEAVAYLAKRRPIEPATYNEDRLGELPIPKLTTPNDSDSDSDVESTQSSTDTEHQNIDENNVSPNENNQTVLNTTASLHDDEQEINLQNLFDTIDPSNDSGSLIYDTDPLADSAEIASAEIASAEITSAEIASANQSQNELNQSAPVSIQNVTQSGAPGTAEKKDFALIVEPTAAKMCALDNIIDDPSFTIYEGDDEIEMMVNNKSGIAKPFKTTPEGLVKRENDVISGNIPFNETKSAARLYKLGNYNLEMPEKIVNTFKDWNTHLDKKHEQYDNRFVHALLILCVDMDNITSDIITEDVLNFIDDFIMVRVQNNEKRALAMKNHMKQLIEAAQVN